MPLSALTVLLSSRVLGRLPQANMKSAPMALNTYGQRRTTALVKRAETDQQNQDKRGHAEPGDHDDFHPHFANGRNIVVDVRIAVKESVAIAKDVCASRQVDEEEECRGDSQSRKSYGINQCEHIMYRRDHFPFGSHSGLLDPRGTRTVR